MEEKIKMEEENKLPGVILKRFNKKTEGLSKKQRDEVLEKLNEEYENAKISPGEAIGIITAESFGEPGTQMSVVTDEELIIKIKDKIKIIKAGEFVDNLIELKGSFKLNDDSEILALNDLEIYVPSINQEEKVEWKRVSEASRHKSPEKLMKITTASGREITATDNHSFVTRIDNSVRAVEGRKLKIGDRIPVLNNFFNESVLNEIKVNENIIDDRIVVENEMLRKAGAKPIRNVIELDDRTGWFVGAYLAEGSCNMSYVSVSNIDDAYIENVKGFASSVGLDYVDRIYQGEYGPSRTLTINSSLLGRFIGLSCGIGSKNKHVPDFAYSASDEFVSGLLRGYFDGDGNFHVDRKMIRASSNSKELINGIALLLSRFKIFSFKTVDNKGQHWLLIPYKYSPLFLAHIGSDIEYKRKALGELAEKAKGFWNNTSQDYTDMISGFGELFHRTATKLGYRTRYINNFTKRQKIGRTALFRYIKIFEMISKEKNIDIKEELKIMRRMFESDVVWDEIAEISYVDKEYEHVYDLSVPGLETFTTAEGIITHNTLNVFHFAGVAEVSVTLGLPRLIELFDARKNIRTPMMEVYLQKPHNKDVDKVRKIAASIKETKLEEFVTEFSINLAKLQVELVINKSRLREFGLNEAHLIKVIGDALKGISIRSADNKLILKTKSKENELLETYKIKEKAKDIFVKGIKGITQVLPVKNQNEFIILTAGSNLKDVFAIKEVDMERTMTNDIFEVAKVLGIEAARQAIMNEAKKVIQDQGLEVDIRHILLISDIMTNTGIIKGITRSGITGEKESVLARASFETPINHIVNASLIGEEDRLSSVIENVMLNQPVPLGTGLPDLIAKMSGSGEAEKEKKEKKK